MTEEGLGEYPGQSSYVPSVDGLCTTASEQKRTLKILTWWARPAHGGYSQRNLQSSPCEWQL